MAKNENTPRDEVPKQPRKILTGSRFKAESLFQIPDFPDSFKFPFNPDNLTGGTTYDIYDEMKDDDQVKAVVALKKDMVINTGWEIVCENDEIKEEITEQFKHINSDSGIDSTFDDVLRDILSSYEYGFSMTEPVYKFVKGKWVYRSIKTRPPHGFLFEIDPHGNVTAIKQQGNPKEFKPNTFLHHVYQPEFGSPFGKSDLRAAFQPWKTKKFVTRMFAIYIERFAMPPAIGTYDETIGENEVAALQTLLEKIQSRTSAMIPKGVTIDFKQPEKMTHDVFLAAIDHYDLKIARAILVPDLMGISGAQTSGGSFALGKEQFKSFFTSIMNDRKSLQVKINTKIIKPLVTVNHGPDVKCEFKFNDFDKENILELIKVWLDAVKGKVFEATDDEINHLRKQTGFPESDEITRPQAPTVPNAGVPGKEGKLPAGNPANDPTRKDDDEKKKDMSACGHNHFSAGNRELTPYEAKVDFTAIERQLNIAENRILPEINNATETVYTDLIDQVKDKHLLTKFNPEALNTLKPRFLRDLNILFKNYYTNLFEQSFTQGQKELFPEDAKNDPAKPNDFVIDMSPEEFEEFLKSEAFSTVGDYSTELTKKTKIIVAKGIKDGAAQSEILRQLRDEMGNFSERWMQTVVRTKTTEIYNEGRKRFFETDPQAKQIVVAYQWSAILDTRTSDICRFLDGKIYLVGEVSNHLKPPAHFGCRSLLVPITKFEEFETTPKKDLTFDKVKKKGGNLISKFVDRSGNLSISGTATKLGDTKIIPGPGNGIFIAIMSINTSNSSQNIPATVGFKGSSDLSTRFNNMIDTIGGGFNKELRDNPWILGNNDAFVINLSADGSIEYTIEFQILNKSGKRMR